MQEIIIEIMNNFGYLGIMFLIAIENIFPPIPSEVILTFGGFATTMKGATINIPGVIISSTIGALIGALVLYMIGRILKKERLMKIASGKISDVIKLDETLANNNLLEIARDIYTKKDKIKVVLMAGPSSSGKTTTSKKLSLYLNSFGLNPRPISIDDYFLPREQTPKLPNGEYDFESLRALNVDLFNEHLEKLLNHEEVYLPRFNFITGESEVCEKPFKLDENDIIIIEGLHGLNDELTSKISPENKYKLYISPLTDLNIDNHNMVSTSDVRLLRRIVRDSRTRGYTAEKTIEKWGLVREGEEKYIFPFQDSPDKIYNTALTYEIGVLKLYAEPLLYEINPTSPYYEEARRLLNFLNMFLVVPTDAIPSDSILREFIGNSYFE